MNKITDKELWVEIFKNPYLDLLSVASDELRDDKDVILLAVKNNGEALKYASDRLQDDEEVVREAFYNRRRSIRYASHRLFIRLGNLF